jgi:hypothetical protein
MSGSPANFWPVWFQLLMMRVARSRAAVETIWRPRDLVPLWKD